MSKIMSCQESICILFRYIIKFHFLDVKKRENRPLHKHSDPQSRPAHVQGQQRLPTKLHIRTSSAFKPATNKPSVLCSANSSRLMGEVLVERAKMDIHEPSFHLFPAQDCR